MIGLFALWAVGFLVVVALAYLAGKHAESKGYSFSLGFWLSMFSSPLVAWAVVLSLPERETKPKADPELMLAIEVEKARMKAEASREGACGRSTRPLDEEHY